MGFFITLLAFAVSVNDCNKWRMAFFATGIILAVPQIGYYQMYMVPWKEMSRCRHAVLRFLGPALVVHYGGQKIAIPETMVGYEKVEALVERNVLFN